MKETIYIVQGFVQQNPDGSLVDVCTFEVYAKTEKEALEKAKKYLKKAHYRVSQVIEK